MRSWLGAGLLGLILLLAGCSTSAPAAVSPTATRVPRVPMVWVPTWGVHLVEGYDIVYYANAYYFYYERRWYVAHSPAGPWALVPSPPAVLAAPAGALNRNALPALSEDAAASTGR
jgi:hypothetical protein